MPRKWEQSILSCQLGNDLEVGIFLMFLPYWKEGRRKERRKKDEKRRKKEKRRERRWGEEGEGRAGRKQDPTCIKPDWLYSQGALISRHVVP